MNTSLINFYASQGWKIFPLLPRRKEPAVKWVDVATDHPDLAAFANDENVGIMTGAKSGIVVLDIDITHGGEDALAELEKQYGKLPLTPTVKTGSGGRHLFFKHPGTEVRNSSSKVGKGIDVRGDGGYVVAGGSTHPNGKKYEWTVKPSETKLSEIPEWLLSKMTARQELEYAHTPTETPQTQQAGAYPTGSRNDTLIRLAGAMRRRDMTREAIYTALLSENKARCVPPLSDSEVGKIVDSVMRYNPSAGSQLTNADRLRAEWMFVRGLYEFPDLVSDYSQIIPAMFSDKKAGDFYAGLVAGKTATDAALDSESLADLQSVKDYDISKMDELSDAIKRLAHLDKVAELAKQLERSARAGDGAGIDRAVDAIAKQAMPGKVISMADALDELDADIQARIDNPSAIWGIPYHYKRLSEYTGGKQRAELTLLAGEPKAGKSWWAHQDYLFSAINYSAPSFIWSGEMKRKQVFRRFYQMLGVNGRNMKQGSLTEDDRQAWAEARALILNSPIYVDDRPLALHEIKPMMVREIAEHGIAEFLFDYAFLITAPGKDEIERTANVSRTLKQIALELNVAVTLITSVNKEGMDDTAALKSNVRGSGQQIHDADVVFILTKFNAKQANALEYNHPEPGKFIRPEEFYKIASLNIAAGREFDNTIEGGRIHYMREGNSPKFVELEKTVKNVSR